MERVWGRPLSPGDEHRTRSDVEPPNGVSGEARRGSSRPRDPRTEPSGGGRDPPAGPPAPDDLGGARRKRAPRHVRRSPVRLGTPPASGLHVHGPKRLGPGPDPEPTPCACSQPRSAFPAASPDSLNPRRKGHSPTPPTVPRSGCFLEKVRPNLGCVVHFPASAASGACASLRSGTLRAAQGLESWQGERG